MNDAYLNMLLLSLVGSQELATRWWYGANRGFDNRCPKDVPDTEVRAYLEKFCFN